MNKMKNGLVAILVSFFVMFSAPSNAMLAGELLEEKDSKVVSRYIMGLVDMLSYLEYANENDMRGKCIYDWYYSTDGTIREVYYYLEKHPDRFAEAILIVLAKRACPLPESKN